MKLFRARAKLISASPASRNRWVYRLALAVVVSLGIAVGLWHQFIGGRSLFTFRNNEPLSSFVIIFAGPLSTLPATLLAIFRPAWGATWLIGGGFLSLVAFVASELMSGEPTAQAVQTAFGYSKM